VRRRLYEEIGVSEAVVLPGLPDFRYEARWGDLEEREICPVFLAYTSQTPVPDPSEVDNLQWVDWDCFMERVDKQPQTLSPWCVLEAPLLNQKFGRSIVSPVEFMAAEPQSERLL
jgi:isopentenyl-diphosphate delta-isomerase